MCGIVGYISKVHIDLSLHLETMKHRGPDSSGVFYDDKLGLGHVRLSIVDITNDANQPYISSDGKYIIVFNGEIYNYKIIRDTLASKGYQFRTTSDTEVLLNAYIEYGQDMFKALDGMFAFAIYNVKERLIFCGRDHVGVKPFFYFLDEYNQIFYFASEMSTLFKFPIRKILNIDSITEFLFNGWIYEPNTAFQDVFKLMPGEQLEINIDTFVVNKKKYFSFASPISSIDLPDIENIVKNSIQDQSYSEVQIGNFFSGGVDSTVIASLCPKELKNLTISYNHKETEQAGIVDDSFYASEISNILKLDTEFITLEENELLSSLEKIRFVSEYTDDLISDFTFLAIAEISKESRKRGYKIMLSGMGADELFCGYPRYNVLAHHSIFKVISLISKPFTNLLNFKSINKKIDRFHSYYDAKSFPIGYSHLLGYFSMDEIHSLTNNYSSIQKYETKLRNMIADVSHLSKLKQGMYLDVFGFLSHNFMISDKASMLQSIELRVPLVNKYILSSNFHTQDNRLIRLNKTKLALRKILYNKLPRKLVDRRKTGFNPPLDSIIMDIGEKKIVAIINNSPLNDIMNLSLIHKIITEHFNLKKNNTYKIWQILYMHYWYIHHFKNS